LLESIRITTITTTNISTYTTYNIISLFCIIYIVVSSFSIYFLDKLIADKHRVSSRILSPLQWFDGDEDYPTKGDEHLLAL
jgi:hypothetical protein